MCEWIEVIQWSFWMRKPGGTYKKCFYLSLLCWSCEHRPSICVGAVSTGLLFLLRIYFFFLWILQKNFYIPSIFMWSRAEFFIELFLHEIWGGKLQLKARIASKKGYLLMPLLKERMCYKQTTEHMQEDL
jgi:hypothetical protein